MEIKIEQPTYPAMFAGIGFHNSESGTYRLLSERFFNEKICKCAKIKIKENEILDIKEKLKIKYNFDILE